jgi:L1 cell adhesion molecule like protein
MVKDNNSLGKFDLNGIPPMPRGQPQIEISYDVNSNGILTVTAVEKSTGKSQNLVIKNDKGRLSEEEIKKMVDEAETFKADDDLQKLKIEKRNGLDQIIYTSLTSIGDQNQELTEYLKEVQTWLESHPEESPEIYDEKVKEIQEKMQTFAPPPTQANEDESANVDNSVPPESATPEDSGPKIEEID